LKLITGADRRCSSKLQLAGDVDGSAALSAAFALIDAGVLLTCGWGLIGDKLFCAHCLRRRRLLKALPASCNVTEPPPPTGETK
jgi:hypothetical protein